jgi:hypothetical protein
MNHIKYAATFHKYILVGQLQTERHETNQPKILHIKEEPLDNGGERRRRKKKKLGAQETD